MKQKGFHFSKGANTAPHCFMEKSTVAAVATQASRLIAPADLSRLIEKIRHSKVVMLGEATHGTEDFYRWRSAISKHLIEREGFSFIAVEGDWPACRILDDAIHSRSLTSVEGGLSGSDAGLLGCGPMQRFGILLSGLQAGTPKHQCQNKRHSTV